MYVAPGQLPNSKEETMLTVSYMNRRRKYFAIADSESLISYFIFSLSFLLFVVRKENELQTITSISSNGDMNSTTGSSGLLSQQSTSQLGTILNATTTAIPGIIIGTLTAAAANSSTMNSI
jgi:hypothetical protein